MWRQLWTIVTSCRFKTVTLKSDCLCTLTLTLEAHEINVRMFSDAWRSSIICITSVVQQATMSCFHINYGSLYRFQRLLVMRLFRCLRFARRSSSMKWCWTALRTTQLFLQTLPVLLHQSCGIRASFTGSTSPPLVWRFMSQTLMQNMPAVSLSGIPHSSFFR